ncbi:transposase family protein [Streptomyces hirsutus]|uniref:transposase family protein n=1 Tax=Streptomyces hirsutus TaxID=35620 RepID=UPI0034014706
MLSPLPSLRAFDGIAEVDAEAVAAAFGTVEAVARGRTVGAACPDCGRFSDQVHDRYQRRLKDLPLAGQGLVIRLAVRRFICGSADRHRQATALRPSRIRTAPQDDPAPVTLRDAPKTCARAEK